MTAAHTLALMTLWLTANGSVMGPPTRGGKRSGSLPPASHKGPDVALPKSIITGELMGYPGEPAETPTQKAARTEDDLLYIFLNAIYESHEKQHANLAKIQLDELSAMMSKITESEGFTKRWKYGSGPETNYETMMTDADSLSAKLARDESGHSSQALQVHLASRDPSSLSGNARAYNEHQANLPDILQSQIVMAAKDMIGSATSQV